jgi:hypothetical protein
VRRGELFFWRLNATFALGGRFFRHLGSEYRAKLIFFNPAPLAYAGAILLPKFTQVREKHSAAMPKFDRGAAGNAPPRTEFSSFAH